MIPVRLGARRFPNKALHPVGNQPMLAGLIQDIQAANLFEDVIIASDDERVLEIAVANHGVPYRTEGEFRNGSHRVAAAVRGLGLNEALVLNVQGDMPGIELSGLAALLHCLRSSLSVSCWTLSRSCRNTQERLDPNRVKVVADERGHARYFSRAAIPHGASFAQTSIHVGIYGFQPNALLRYVESPISELSRFEDLEQLDWLAAGYAIGVCATEWQVPSLDEPGDVAAVQAWFNAKRAS